tara:strand:- start:297 stop:698 length:402 start_codon:yes stop_codon:yes gene_type:complete
MDMKYLTLRVRVYWNLHKKLWSIQSTKTNKVIGHDNHVVLSEAKFVVRKGGQKRVREQGKKNVHAFAVGMLASPFISHPPIENFGWNRVRYNPYEDDYFKVNSRHLNRWKDLDPSWMGNIVMEQSEQHPRVYI